MEPTPVPHDNKEGKENSPEQDQQPAHECFEIVMSVVISIRVELHVPKHLPSHPSQMLQGSSEMIPWNIVANVYWNSIFVRVKQEYFADF